MRPFTYVSADNPKGALRSASANSDSHYLGGGTNLLDLMKEGVERPTQLVEVADLDLKRVKKNANGGFSIGATLSNSATANHPLVMANYPLLSMTMLAAATVQIRNMATNGGNLLQRTRCPYFYETSMPCNKREPGSGCGALNGYNNTHAIFGWSESCVATNPSDMNIALAALDASVKVMDTDGNSRTIPFADFHRLPGSEPERDNNLRPNELVTSIELPAPQFQDHYHYLKIRERSSYAFALISVAAGLKVANDRITKAGLALGGVAHKPWKLVEAEEFLTGRAPTEENFAEAAKLALRGAKPLSHNAYKVPMSEKGIARALERAYARKA